ncbi:MAG: outer membrane protein transport protein [Chlamydiae bacterium]|nr:outer membrane protein transport protein [Chlamydiota bacterium]
MKKNKTAEFVAYGLGIWMVFIFSASSAYAIGFRLYDEGAKAQGQAGAYTAQADDASSLYYNPAAMPSLKGDQALTGAEFIFLDTDYTSTSGVEESSENDMGMVPHFYAVKQLNKKWAIGLGVYSLFGLATEYNDRGAFRYVTTSSELRTMDVSPVIAYQLTPELSAAAGLDVVIGSADLRSKVDFGALAGISGMADGNSRLAGDGEGLGFNVSLLYQPHVQHRFGILFHSPVDLDLDGSVVLSSIPNFVGVGSTVTGDLSTEIDLPAIIRFGYAYTPTSQWKIEFDLDWSNFSSYNELDLRSTNPLFPSTIVPKDYDDGYVFAIGTQYLLNESWALRAGYGHILASVPDSTFDPIVPDADRNFVTVGLGYEWKMFTVDAAYQAIFFDDRNIDNDVGASVGSTVDGHYETFVHAFVIDVKMSF